MGEKLIGNVALVIGSVILSLLAIEASLWIHGYLKGDRFPHAYDAELGWAPRLNVREHDYLSGTIVTTLEDGTRSNASGEVQNATNPILAVGDSFTWGENVSDWETWPAQLEKLSGRRVINGGVSGYGTDQAFLRARRFLSRNRFSVLIFSFIPGDIERGEESVLYHIAKPYFDLKDGRLTLENVPVPPPPPKGGGLLATLKRSLLVNAVIKRMFPKLENLQNDTRVLDEQEGRAVACALFHELEEVTKSRGSQLIVVLQHYEAETVAEVTTAEYALSCLSDPATQVLDLKPALSELKTSDLLRYSRLYISNDAHMTAEGNQFVAQEILPILKERLMKSDGTFEIRNRHGAARDHAPVQRWSGMRGAYLGPALRLRRWRNGCAVPGRVFRIGEGEETLIGQTLDGLTEENAVGWFQGRVEFGPRALGARSILGDPRSPRCNGS